MYFLKMGNLSNSCIDKQQVKTYHKICLNCYHQIQLNSNINVMRGSMAITQSSSFKLATYSIFLSFKGILFFTDYTLKNFDKFLSNFIIIIIKIDIKYVILILNYYEVQIIDKNK